MHKDIQHFNMFEIASKLLSLETDVEEKIRYYKMAEDMNIKATVLKKAIKVAHKMEFGQTQRDHELLENILTTVGKTL
jgi:hypothetical protein